MEGAVRVEVAHDGLDLSDGAEELFLGLLDDFEGGLCEDLFADDIAFALLFVGCQVFGYEFVLDLEVLGEGHFEFMRHLVLQ